MQKLLLNIEVYWVNYLAAWFHYSKITKIQYIKQITANTSLIYKIKVQLMQ